MDLHPASAGSWRRPHTTRTAGSLAPLPFVGVVFGCRHAEDMCTRQLLKHIWANLSKSWDFGRGFTVSSLASDARLESLIEFDGGHTGISRVRSMEEVATAMLMPWSPPSFRAPEPSSAAPEPAHVDYYVGNEVGLLAHRALSIALNRLGRVGYPATCPTSSACGSARLNSNASILVSIRAEMSPEKPLSLIVRRVGGSMGGVT
ncbi:hypothetical protein HaLaN_09752 [Haematococcus lacustris]|uniref:Uncharacterized protein n=1 Tax=Haematococcus lacustris TaxID=44745 RepID=A0A699ZE53_HAELA|nr:hypothetical protein HaLaN_09752 [Haematococcus lacustris]